jgi:hypothetical protein
MQVYCVFLAGFFGVLGTCGDRLPAAAGSFEVLGECRQSGALIRKRSRNSIKSTKAFSLNPQET